MGSIAIRNALRDQLAGLATLRAWLATGHTVADAAAAKAHIYPHSLPKPAAGNEYTQTELETYRPYLILARDRYRAESLSNSTGVATAIFRLLFVESIDADDAADRQTPATTFETTVDGILDELWEGSVPASGNLPIAAVELLDGPWRNDEDEQPRQGIAQALLCTVEIGLQP